MELFLEVILPIVAGVAFVIALFFYARFIYKRARKRDGELVQNPKKVIRGVKVRGFLNQRLRFFLATLEKALPSHFIIIPNVNAEMLFAPEIRCDIRFDDAYCDFVIFDKEYNPILVIDMAEPTIGRRATGHLCADAVRMLGDINLPILTVEMRDNYDIGELRLNIAQKMNPLLRV